MATVRTSRITNPSAQSGGVSVAEAGKCPVVRWRDVGPDGVMPFMTPLLAENRPFLLTGYWSHQVLNKDAALRWTTFAGIKSVLAAHGLGQLRVDVACTKKGSSFRGDQANRQHVSLRLMDLVELAEANEAGKPHWAGAEEVGLDYFLCQCPVVSREDGKPEVLSAIAGEFRMPSCVAEEDLLQINLWLGAMETTTNMHYDANHNLLFVLKGKKRVALLPPNMTAGVSAMPVFSESANHSGLPHGETAAVVGSDEAMRNGAVYADVAEGEALFIPEGWWHQITSSSGTVAVNVWFKGVRPALCEGPSRHMREYYLRCLCESLLGERLRDAARAASEGGGSKGENVAATGHKRRKTAALPSFEASPLIASISTPEERNAYLRSIGTERMKEELPRVALTRPVDWARLVTGLDPLTVHVLTTQWETAGGATSMPEFYEAIFGGVGQQPADGAAPAAEADSVDGGGSSRNAGVGSVSGGDAVLGGMEGAATDAAFTGVVGGDPSSLQSEQHQLQSGQQQQQQLDPGQHQQQPLQSGHQQQPQETGGQGREQDVQHQQQQQQQHLEQPVSVGTAAVGVAAPGLGRWEEFSGVALQERLVRLKEAFAQDECRKLLNDAVGI